MTPSTSATRDRFFDELVSVISHDLRTPLTVIIGYSELLQARDDEQTQAEAPLRIAEAAQRLWRMIDDLLATAALDSGTVIAHPVSLDLEQATKKAISRVRECGEQHSFQLETETISVDADPEQLAQILTNIAFLACTSTGPGTVVIDACAEAGQALLRVAAPGALSGALEHAKRLALLVATRLAELNGGALDTGADSWTLSLPLSSRLGGV